MHINKILKGLIVALPMLTLAACSSNSSTEQQSQAATNTSAEPAQAVDTVQVSAAKKAAAIEEQKRQQMDMLRQQQIIHFDFDKSSIDAKYATLLEAHAKFLNENPTVKVLVEGHTDERGTPEYNIALGERRAKAVVTYLENLGVSASQLSTVSYGEEKPLSTAMTEEGFAQNRRAVLVY